MINSSSENYWINNENSDWIRVELQDN